MAVSGLCTAGASDIEMRNGGVQYNVVEDRAGQTPSVQSNRYIVRGQLKRKVDDEIDWERPDPIGAVALFSDLDLAEGCRIDWQ